MGATQFDGGARNKTHPDLPDTDRGQRRNEASPRVIMVGLPRQVGRPSG
jgi:hypothetical protein